ncbi:MAG: hypothetical protein DWQ29_11185, partial [Planctomycetota bacterium]
KIKMVVQCTAVPCCLLSMSPAFSAWLDGWWDAGVFLSLRDCVLWLTVAITVYSGIEYVWRAVRMLGGDEASGPAVGDE